VKRVDLRRITRHPTSVNDNEEEKLKMLDLGRNHEWKKVRPKNIGKTSNQRSRMRNPPNQSREKGKKRSMKKQGRLTIPCACGAAYEMLTPSIWDPTAEGKPMT
jgi:hypothetical protein